VEKTTKICVIGLDAALPKRIMKYVEEGVLPNFEKLIRTGVIAENCLVPLPTITPPNWTTIATGSWPGTHGITDYHVTKPGNSLSMAGTHQGFNRNDCLVENIWEAAEKVGKKSIVFNFPSSWPSRLKEGIVVGGNSNIINDWRTENRGTVPGAAFTVCADQIVSTFLYPRGGVKIEFDEADGWENAPQSNGQEDLEAEYRLPFRESQYEMAPTTWYFLVQDSAGKGYDRLTISPTKDCEQAFCTLGVGEWSKKIFTTLMTKDGEKKEVSFHVKLMELSADATSFRVYISCLGESEGWSSPPGIDKEIMAHSPEGDFGLRGGGLRAFRSGWIDLDTYVEIQDLENIFLAEAAEYLLRNKEWDIFFMHAHAIDWMEHGFLTLAEPLVNKDEASVKLYQDGEKRFYQSIDRMIGRVVEAAGKGTVISLISDHGAVASATPHNPLEPLIQKGLLTLAEGQTVKVGTGDEGMAGLRAAVIDWSKTKAVPQRAVHIYVNLKGRDPDGIVEPEDYDNVRQEIIDALMTYVDPATGKRPFAMALRREDARPFGMYGDRAGDVIYAVYPWFGGQHGYILPTAEWGIGSLKGLFVLNGPNIKKGTVLTRTVWITDLVPTLCHLADLPMPENVEGAVVYQAFKDPNFKLKEMQKLREGLARMETALARQEREPWDKHDCA